MSESLKSVGAITMFIDDTQRSKAFYEQVFGAPAEAPPGSAAAPYGSAAKAVSDSAARAARRKPSTPLTVRPPPSFAGASKPHR